MQLIGAQNFAVGALDIVAGGHVRLLEVGGRLFLDGGGVAHYAGDNGGEKGRWGREPCRRVRYT